VPVPVKFTQALETEFVDKDVVHALPVDTAIPDAG
jgi:hypothetical protein